MGFKKYKLIITALIVVLTAAVIMAAAALLIHETTVEQNVVFGEIDPNATDFILSSTNALNFTRAGEIINIGVNVKSNTDTVLGYRYELKADSVSGIENAIFVYFRGEYIGALGGAEPLRIAAAGFAAGKGDVIADELSFKLHSGVSGSFTDAKTATVMIKLMTETIDYERDLFVGSFDELKSALNDVNYGGGNKTLHIASDIKLESDLIIRNAMTLDMMNGKIDFNGFKILIDSGAAGEIVLTSSRGRTYYGGNTAKSIIISSQDALIRVADSLDAEGLIDIVSYSDRLLKEAVYQNARELLEDGLKSGSVIDPAGKLSIYGANAVDPGEDYALTADGKVAFNAYDTTKISALNVGGKAIEFKLYGGSESMYSAQIDLALEHISALSRSGTEISSDIFLPKRVEEYNMSIAWESDKPQIIDSDGRVSEDAGGSAILRAYITINNDTIVREFTLMAYKQDNRMRFDYLVARIGEKELNALCTNPAAPEAGSSFRLPIVKEGDSDDYRKMYGMGNMNLLSLSYSLDVNADYLGFYNGNTVTLEQPTFDEGSDIIIRGIFKNEPDVVYEGTIHVNIAHIDNQQLHQEIIDYLQGLLNNISILDNILDTRAKVGMANERGDFSLPSTYKIYSLKYTLDGAAQTDKGDIISSVTPSGDLVKISIDAEKFKREESREVFYVHVEMSRDPQIQATVAPLYVNAPAALHASAREILDDSDLFYSLKLQTIGAIQGDAGVPQLGSLEAQETADAYGVPTSEYAFSVELHDALAPDYILLYDYNRLKTVALILDEGSTYIGAGSKYKKGRFVRPDGSKFAGFEAYYMGLSGGALMKSDGGYAFNTDFIALLPDIERLLIYNAGLAANGESDAFLEYALELKPSVRVLHAVEFGLKDASYIAKLPSIAEIDLSANTGIRDFAFLINIGHIDKLMIDLTDTAFIASDTPIFDALMYRNPESEFYYTVNGAIVRHTLKTEDELLAAMLLYSLSMPTELKSEYIQLLNSIKYYSGGANGETPVTWSIAEGTAAEIVAETNGLTRLINKTAQGAVAAAVKVEARLTIGQVTMTRVFTILIHAPI